MRWKNEPLPEEGKLYIRKYFAFLPVTIGNETRWLEFVKVEGYWIQLWVRWNWLPVKFLN